MLISLAATAPVWHPDTVPLSLKGNSGIIASKGLLECWCHLPLVLQYSLSLPLLSVSLLAVAVEAVLLYLRHFLLTVLQPSVTTQQVLLVDCCNLTSC